MRLGKNHLKNRLKPRKKYSKKFFLVHGKALNCEKLRHIKILRFSDASVILDSERTDIVDKLGVTG